MAIEIMVIEIVAGKKMTIKDISIFLKVGLPVDVLVQL